MAGSVFHNICCKIVFVIDVINVNNAFFIVHISTCRGHKQCDDSVAHLQPSYPGGMLSPCAYGRQFWLPLSCGDCGVAPLGLGLGLDAVASPKSRSRSA